MSLLSDIQTTLAPLNIPIETGVFTDKAPDTYMVVTPLSDVFDLHADNEPGVDVQEARISLYSKTNYQTLKNAVVRSLLQAGITITARQYIGYETDTGYHHFNVDTAQYYEFSKEEL